MTGAEAVVRRHVDAFNAADLEALLACFAADATWVTGTDSFRGRDELRELCRRARITSPASTASRTG